MACIFHDTDSEVRSSQWDYKHNSVTDVCFFLLKIDLLISIFWDLTGIGEIYKKNHLYLDLISFAPLKYVIKIMRWTEDTVLSLIPSCKLAWNET